MTWPTIQENEWRLFISELADAPYEFFLLIYDRSFTYDAIFRRLQLKFEESNWQLIRGYPSDRLVTYIEKKLQDGPVKAIWIQLDNKVSVSQLTALNLIREKLYDLPTNIILVAQTDAYSRLLTVAHDLTTWIQLPHKFALPITQIPDLPDLNRIPSTQSHLGPLGYYREQIQTAIEQGNERRVFQLIPSLADLYLDAEMYETASTLYRSLINYHEMGANYMEANRYHQKLHVAEGWRILENLDNGRIEPTEQYQLENLIESEAFMVRRSPNGLMLVDTTGRAKLLSAELFVRLGILSEKVQKDWTDTNTHQAEPTLPLADAEQSYAYTASRYGIGYNLLQISWYIESDGSARVERIVDVEAYSEIDRLDTFMRIPEKFVDGEEHSVDFLSIESLSLDRDITIVDVKKEVALQRLSALVVITPQLRRGENITYKMREDLPPNLYAIGLTESEIKEREVLLDYIGWSISRPTRKLSLQVFFPVGAKPEIFGFEVRFATASGFPSEQLNYAEQRRLNGPSRKDNDDGTCCLIWEVDYPMTGLIYILWWRPVAKED